MSSYISIEGLDSSDELYKEAEALLVEHQNLRSVIDDLVEKTSQLRLDIGNEGLGSELRAKLDEYEQLGDPNLSEYKEGVRMHTLHGQATQAISDLKDAIDSSMSSPLDVSLVAALESAMAAYIGIEGLGESNTLYQKGVSVLAIYRSVRSALDALPAATQALQDNIGDTSLASALRDAMSKCTNLEPKASDASEYEAAQNVLNNHGLALPAIEGLRGAISSLKSSLDNVSLVEPLNTAMSSYISIEGLDSSDELYKEAEALLVEHQNLRSVIDDLVEKASQLRLDIGNEGLGSELRAKLDEYEQLGDPNLSEYKEGVRMHTLHGQATQAISDLKDAIDSSMANPLDASLVTLLENTMGSYVGIEGLTEGDTLYQKGVSVLAIYRSVRSALDALPAATQSLRGNLSNTGFAAILQEAMSKCANLEPKTEDTAEYTDAALVMGQHESLIRATEALTDASKALEDKIHDESLIAPLDTAMQDYLGALGTQNSDVFARAVSIKERHTQVRAAISTMVSATQELMDKLDEREKGAALLSAIGAYTAFQAGDIEELTQANTAIERHNTTLSLLEIMENQTEALKNNLALASFGDAAQKAREDYLQSGGQASNEKAVENAETLDLHRAFLDLIEEMAQQTSALAADISNETLGAQLREKLDAYEQQGDPNLAAYKEANRVHVLHERAKAAISGIKDAINAAMSSPLDSSLMASLESAMTAYCEIEGLTEGDTLYQKGVSVLAIYRSVRSALDALPAATQALQDNIGDTSLASALRDAMSKCTNLEPKASGASEYEAAQNVLNNHGLALPAIEGLRGAISSLKSSLDKRLFGRATQHGNVLLHLHRGFGFL